MKLGMGKKGNPWNEVLFFKIPRINQTWIMPFKTKPPIIKNASIIYFL